MTDKNTADAKTPKNSSGVHHKGSIVDVKKIIAPVNHELEKQYSKSSTKSQFGLATSSNNRQHDY